MKKFLSNKELKYIEYGLIYLVVITVLDFPHFLQVKFNLPHIIFDRQFSILLPLCFLIFYAVYQFQENNKGITKYIADFKAENILFVSMILTWFLIETYHYINGIEELKISTIFRYLCFFFLFVLLRNLTFIKNAHYKIYWAVMHMIVFLCLLQLLSLAGVLSGLQHGFIPFLEKPTDTHVNIISFIVVLGWWLFLSMTIKLDARVTPLMAVYLAIFIISLLVNQSRGAILLFVLITAIFYIYTTKSPAIKYFIMAVLVIGASALSYNMFTSSVTLSTTSYARLLTVDESANLRMVINKKMLTVVIDNPVIGVGENAASNIKYQSYSTHTHYVRLLAQYGIPMFFVYLFVVAYGFGLRFRRCDFVSVSAAIVFFGTQTFEPDMFWWYAILFFFVTSENYKKKGVAV